MALAVVASLGAVTAPPAARAGTVDITPPEVGSCHDLTWEEAYGDSDPIPAVPCTEPHTLLTTKVFTFDESPDWSSTAFYNRIITQCFAARADLFGGQEKKLKLSSYIIWTFFPTEAQRDAGAAWVRCDTGVYSTRGRTAEPMIKNLPTDGPPTLGTHGIDDSVALCRMNKRKDFGVTTCDRPHIYRAAAAVLYPGTSYPGQHRINSWTIDRCRHELHRTFGYWSAPSRYIWNRKVRYSTCYKSTSR